MPNDDNKAKQIVSKIKSIDWDKIDKGEAADDGEESAPKVTFDNPMGNTGPENKINKSTAPMDFTRYHPGVWKTTTGTRKSFNAP